MSKRSELLDSLEDNYREYAGSEDMYRNARAYAERDLDAYRAEVLHEAADAVASFTGNGLDANAKMLRRLAAEGKGA